MMQLLDLHLTLWTLAFGEMSSSSSSSSKAAKQQNSKTAKQQNSKAAANQPNVDDIGRRMIESNTNHLLSAAKSRCTVALAESSTIF
jgi:hypothetical protein